MLCHRKIPVFYFRCPGSWLTIYLFLFKHLTHEIELPLLKQSVRDLVQPCLGDCGDMTTGCLQSPCTQGASRCTRSRLGREELDGRFLSGAPDGLTRVPPPSTVLVPECALGCSVSMEDEFGKYETLDRKERAVYRPMLTVN